MALLKINNTSIKGIVSCVPKHIEKSIDYKHITIEERELFIKSTGIEERRVANENTTAFDLGLQASEHLIQKLNWHKEDIGLVIFVTQSPDYFLPATSILLQHKLQLSKSCMAFDLNLGCSGYVYGLSVISNLVSTGAIKKAILVVGDKSTLSTNYKDKSTYPLFGDAVTATAIEYNENASASYFNLQSDGSGEDAIKIPHGGCRNFFTEKSFITEKIEEGIERAPKNLKLDGIEVFNFSLREVSPNINDLLKFSNKDLNVFDYFVFHQANKLMNESVRKKLKITEKEKVPYSIGKFGNTSSASIPLTLCFCLKDELTTKNVNLLLSGFGVGFSWGSAIIETKQLQVVDLIEYEPC